MGTMTSAGPRAVRASWNARWSEPGTSWARTGWSTHTGYSPPSPSSRPARKGSSARWRRSCWPTATTSGARLTRAVASAPTALPRPAVVCRRTNAGSPRPSAPPVAMPTTDPSWRASTKRRWSGRPARNGTSVEPGLEKIVVSPSLRSSRNVASRTVEAGGSAFTRDEDSANHLVDPGSVGWTAMATASGPEDARFATARWDASEQIAMEIRRYLEREGLQPGDRIGTEQELAAEFGVSRPTLREALRLLASSHLIRVGRGRAGGIFVARTPNEGMSRNVSESISMMLATESISLSQLLDARLFLEVPLAGLAATNAGDETAAEPQGALDDATGHDPGTPPFNAADKRFHQSLARAAGNELLLAFTDWILDVLQPQLIADISERVDGALILRQHADIQRAVKRRQPAAAEKAMRAHIMYLRDIHEAT